MRHHFWAGNHSLTILISKDMNKYLLIISIAFLTFNIEVPAQSNYMDYHKEVIKCEQLIVEGKFKDAIVNFDSLFDRFDFVFLRECQLATGLSVFEQDSKSAFRFLALGIKQGWSLKDINKNKNLRPLKNDPQWHKIVSEYDSIHKIYLSKLNSPLREEIREIYKNDQKIALRVFLRIGEKNRVKYAMKKFTPHSEKTLLRLAEILIEHGYPGEKLIGNNWWVSVSLVHHNSIYTEYTKKDTLYLNIRPELVKSIEKGELHPYKFALIEDWRHSVLYEHQLLSYGYLEEIPDEYTLQKNNENRKKMGIRSIELRNKLLDIEKETGLNLYIPKDWKKGRITVASK